MLVPGRDVPENVSTHPTRIVIVDDHAFLRDVMARALARQRTRYSILATVGTAAEAIAACREFRPDLLILDINLPDRNAIDALPELRRVAPATRVLLCTGFPTGDRISDLAALGAHGFVEKTNTWDEFLHAVEQVSHGEYYFCSHNAGGAPESWQKKKSERTPLAPYLTPREKEIIALVAQGFTSKEIAAKLHISVATVETHRTNLMAKLRVRNVAELVSWAFRMGQAKPNPKTPLAFGARNQRNA
jgi:DNA-binding NarL/FixJ family response regulator